jgi:tetrahydromethanopterin S-methyltransferase subunit G
MYSSAQDNENQVGQAKGIIQGVVVGLVAFVAMYAFFQYLIPGGVFS